MLWPLNAFRCIGRPKAFGEFKIPKIHSARRPMTGLFDLHVWKTLGLSPSSNRYKASLGHGLVVQYHYLAGM